MGGTGLGMGSMGSFGSTLGYGATGGGSPSANTTAAVTNPGTGKLEAYDPTTMTTQTKPITPPAGPINAVGMSSSGVPDYVSNWLAGGGGGVAPTSTNMGGFANSEQSTKGTLFHPTLVPRHTATTSGTPTGTPTTGGTLPATTPTPAASTPATAGITQVPGSGLPQGGFQQPLFVNDQWQGGTGTSQPVATPALGSGFQPQFAAPIFTDGKGNFFSDPQGKVPLGANAAQQAKNSMGLWGHV
jgi:hypothetical protein